MGYNMFSHKDIWLAIDRLAESRGYSASGLAKQAGLDPTSFNKSKRVSADGKPRWPSTESISKVLAVTGLTMSDFSEFTDSANSNAPSHGVPYIEYSALSSKLFDKDGAPKTKLWPLKDIEGVNGPNCFTIEVDEASSDNIYNKGSLLVVLHTAKYKKNNIVVLNTKGDEFIIGKLITKNDDSYEIEINSNEAPLIISTSNIRWISRVIWQSQ